MPSSEDSECKRGVKDGLQWLERRACPKDSGVEAGEVRGQSMKDLEYWAKELEPSAVGNVELLENYEQGRDTVRSAS